MNEPLCLPRSVDCWEELRHAILQYLGNCHPDPCVIEGVPVLREVSRNDSEGVFSYTLLNPHIGRRQQLKGYVSSCWDNDGKTYYVIQIEGHKGANVRTGQPNPFATPSIEKTRSHHHVRKSKR